MCGAPRSGMSPPPPLTKVQPSPGPTWALGPPSPQAPVMTPSSSWRGFIDTDVPGLGLQSSSPALELGSRGAQSSGGSSEGGKGGGGGGGLLLLSVQGLR